MNLSILKIIVLGLVICVILAVVGMIYLVSQDRSIPQTLETIVIAGFTGLLGLLAPSRTATDPNA